MKVWKSILVTVAVVALAGTASAATSIGIYWDQEGTQQSASYSGGSHTYHPAYVVITEAEMMVGGAAFMVELDEAIYVVGVDYPDAISLGDLKEGVGIGFQTCVAGWESEPVVCAVLNLWTGTQLLTDGELRVVAHPQEGGVWVSDCEGTLYAATGLTSYLTITVDADETSWGAVKGLYK